MTDPQTIASKLTKAQREAIMTGRAQSEQVGLELLRLGITRYDLRSRVKVYSDLGLSLRTHLEKEASK
jgi:hypothetical protein